MAIMIVVWFEIIDVDHEQRQIAAMTFGMPHRQNVAFVEETSVIDAGEAISDGFALERIRVRYQHLFASNRITGITDLNQTSARPTFNTLHWRHDDGLMHAHRCLTHLLLRIQWQRGAMQCAREQRWRTIIDDIVESAQKTWRQLPTKQGNNILLQGLLMSESTMSTHPVVPQQYLQVFTNDNQTKIDAVDHQVRGKTERNIAAHGNVDQRILLRYCCTCVISLLNEVELSKKIKCPSVWCFSNTRSICKTRI